MISFAERNPHLVKEWSDKNEVSPDQVTSCSNKKYWFRCDKGHEWQAYLNNRTCQGKGCPYCGNKVVCNDNCLATCYPKIAAEWHPTRNGSITAHHVIAGSAKKYWFQCDKDHVWQTSPNERTQGRGCPYCDNKFVCNDNCLATCFPKIAAEWHPTRNGSITAHHVIAGSAKKYWFQCDKGHEWIASLTNRTCHRKGCPYCGNKVVCNDNCLATCYPKIAAEWHPTRNGSITPEQVVAGTAKKYWFQCSKGHEWRGSLTNRTYHDRGCPRCNESKGEKKIVEILSTIGIRYRRQVKFKGCRYKNPLPFDFIIFPKDKDPGIIEYHGAQHYVPVAVFGGIKALASNQMRDAIKREFCVDNKLSMLEIPYYDFNKIEELIKSFVNDIPPLRQRLSPRV